MTVMYHETTKKYCEGCSHEYPSQRDHVCLMMPLEERIDLLFDLLFEKVDECHATELCYEKLKGEDDIYFKLISNG